MCGKRLLKIFSYFIIILCLWSCKKDSLHDCFESAGSPSTITNVVPYFNQISVYDDVNVFIAMGPQEQVQVQGGSNIIQNISTTVSNGVLTLKNNNICDWIRSYKKSVINVYLTMPAISFITSNGIGTIQSTDTIYGDSLQIQTVSGGDVQLMVHTQYIAGHLFGAGDLTLSGYCNQFQCDFFSGTGFAYCDKLTTDYTFFSTASTGDCYVSTTGVLDAIIYKNGNMYYAGNPTVINCKTYGSGQLMKE